MNLGRLAFCLLFFIACAVDTFSQTTKAKFGKGISLMAEDSSMYLKFTTRFQSLYELKQRFVEGNTDGPHSNKILIRRARLKFDGFVLSPKLKYKIELGLSNRDVGGSGDVPQFNKGSNIILDAVLKWNFFENLELWCGQTKLPGNRERVVSSQKLQLVDRSLLNSRFNIDRDVGVQLRNKGVLGGDIVVKEAFAISMGEGRNVTSSTNGGYSYTARVEVLPFGEFAKKGDYFGADLQREQSPKLAIGATYEYNRKALRSRGQLGSFIEGVPGSLNTIFADFMFKFKGFSAMGEFANRTAVNLQVVDGATINPYLTGQAVNLQVGYLCNSNYEVATRVTTINPENSDSYNQYTLGVSKYVVGHSLKVQSDISFLDFSGVSQISDLMFRFQVEMQL